MTTQTKKWGKLTAIMVIVALCCFVFAGSALANGQNPVMDIDPDQVKANHTYLYDFKVDGLNINASNFYNRELNINFDGDFDLSPSAGTAFYIEAYTSGGQKKMQVVPEINGTTATFVIQSANLDKEVVLYGFNIYDLVVKSPCQPGEYDVLMSHELPGLLNLYNSVRVIDTVKSIEITEIITGNGDSVSKAGAPITVNGRITANCCEEWPFTSWNVELQVFDLKGRPAINPVEGDCGEGSGCSDCGTAFITGGPSDYCQPHDGNSACPEYDEDGRPVGDDMQPVCTSVVWDGVSDYATFTATVKTPAYMYKNRGEWTNEYVVMARTAEIRDYSTIPGSELEPEAGALEDYTDPNHGWGGACGEGEETAVSDPVNFTFIPAEPICIDLNGPAEMKLNKAYELTIDFVDKYCNRAPTVKQEKLDLASFQRYENAVAGRFFDSSGNEISHIYVDPGTTQVKVTFIPVLDGDIKIEARIENLAGTIDDVKCDGLYVNVLNDCGPVAVEAHPIVFDENDNPMYGWPFKAAYWINGPGATENYKVHVEITGPNGEFFKDINNNGMYDRGEEWGTWDPELNVCYQATGRLMGHNICQPFDTIDHEFCTSKKDFYVYPNPRLAAAFIDTENTLNVKVVVEDDCILPNSVNLGTFVNPVELVRVLQKDTWQVISTPKYLAKPRSCVNGFGTFADMGLTAGTIDLLAWYKNGVWNYAIGADASSVVPEPLVAYYARMHQKNTPNDYSTINANYVFARAVLPGQDVPPTRVLGLGWNAVGVSVQDLTDNLMAQPDFMYRFLGGVCQGCKLVYNPRLGNLAQFGTIAVSSGTAESWALDPLNMAFNGDCYWLYLTESQELPANDGLDLVDP